MKLFSRVEQWRNLKQSTLEISIILEMSRQSEPNKIVQKGSPFYVFLLLFVKKSENAFKGIVFLFLQKRKPKK